MMMTLHAIHAIVWKIWQNHGALEICVQPWRRQVFTLVLCYVSYNQYLSADLYLPHWWIMLFSVFSNQNINFFMKSCSNKLLMVYLSIERHMPNSISGNGTLNHYLLSIQAHLTPWCKWVRVCSHYIHLMWACGLYPTSSPHISTVGTRNWSGSGCRITPQPAMGTGPESPSCFSFPFP